MRQYIRERKYVYTAMALATLATLATGSPTFAEDNTRPTTQSSTLSREPMGGSMKEAVKSETDNIEATDTGASSNIF